MALHSYNELNPVMELVLFEDAISHVCRFVDNWFKLFFWSLLICHKLL